MPDLTVTDAQMSSKGSSLPDDGANNRACGVQIRDELGELRQVWTSGGAFPFPAYTALVDALTGVAMQIAECGCSCCSINVATIVALVDLEP